MLLALKEVLQDLLALGVTDLLQDHLLGGLGTDTTEIDRLQRLLEVVTRLDLRIVLLGIGQRNLQVFVDVFVVGNHLPTTEGLEVARITVDHDAHLGFVVDALLGRRCERQLKGTENDFLGDILFAGQCIDQQQHFTAHGLKPPGPSVESGHETCLFDIVKFEFHIVLFQAQTDLAIGTAEQGSLEIAAIVLGDAQLDLNILTGKAGEICLFLDDTVHARGGDFEAVKIDILDLENTGQLIRHLRAVININPALLFGGVDEDTNGPAARRHFDIDELKTETDNGRFNQRIQIHGYK